MTTESSSLRTVVDLVDLKDISIKPLDRAHDRAAFCCGVEKIDNFCRNNAREQHEANQVRVYDAVHEARVAGYYYLIASTRLPDAVSAEAPRKFGRVNEAPCVYLGMIGVSRDYKGNGIGKLLMADAMAKTLQVADLIGIYALVLDALDDKVAQFYESLGFMRFVDGERKMFIPLQTIKNALSAT